VLNVKAIEAVWVYPHDYETNDPLKPNWYKPSSWFVMGKQISPQEPRVAKGGKGAGEWTKGNSPSPAFLRRKAAAASSGEGSTKRAAAEEYGRRLAAKTESDKRIRATQEAIRSYQDENAPAANLEGDTPEAKAKTKSIREMAASMGLEPSEFYYGGSAPKESLMGVGGVTMAYASNGSTVANGKKFPEGVVVFDPPPEASDHIQRGRSPEAHRRQPRQLGRHARSSACGHRQAHRQDGRCGLEQIRRYADRLLGPRACWAQRRRQADHPQLCGLRSIDPEGHAQEWAGSDRQAGSRHSRKRRLQPVRAAQGRRRVDVRRRSGAEGIEGQSGSDLDIDRYRQGLEGSSRHIRPAEPRHVPRRWRTFAKYDDQVDASSRAFMALLEAKMPMRISQEALDRA
jgi:hypothetical protein